ncbi:PLP-dependent aminotransferase family protein [Pectobacterium brasiliense]|mgnify:FL=1|uniref:aminotransferase-like domain-containing protein n=1 Tax=Pectobacterium brasiliense TaxID=180957 RepID=UPI0006515FFD|nr:MULTISPECIES: PLP-dependent aminotransferase family protein [Pectobacterium]ARA74470.1 GntR family transcriptional regulator [Pectobacterium brasiliense]KMK86578.1 putative GntR family transcriptional regulator [Pectobacterium brasiliense ICMP 19477]MBN3190946.1 PLP-dependent aminotransferase family protein [Pectobacterium brasiliense]MCA5920750.1 PLP-dependent aminotransferase family protein [Pectobacterium brasiliense]MCA5928130.1 PLP-dependent aminotransferase family protein [Pectobacter
MAIEGLLAHRIAQLKSSAIRELLKHSKMENIISLAGGIPSDALFDFEGLSQATQLAITEQPKTAFQYGLTEGSGVLRDRIAELCAVRGVKTRGDDIVVTAGSQQALDLIMRAMVDPGDVFVVERPTYLAALQTLELAQAQVMSVSSDADGMVVDELEELLKKQRIKGVYIVPNFGNPSGVTLSYERRLKLIQLAERYGFVIIEDDPYGELRFTEERNPTLFQLAQEQLGSTEYVLYTSTFSKVLAPGLRLGWAILPDWLLHKVAIIKQAADLHASALSQTVAECYLGLGRLDTQIEKIRHAYKHKGELLAQLVEKELGDVITFNQPKGGMFLWAKFRQDDFNTTEWLKKTLDQGVVFVPGEFFFPDNIDYSTLRLSFATATDEQMHEAVARLRRAL